MSREFADRLEVSVRSLNGDAQTLGARGAAPRVVDGEDGLELRPPARGDRVWVAEDEGGALVVVAWEPIS